MQTQDKNQPSVNNEAKDKRTEFFEKREQNANLDDADNAGDDSFTPIYLNDETVLQTPEEKKHDESVDPQKNDKVETTDTNSGGTVFDRMNDEAGSGNDNA